MTLFTLQDVNYKDIVRYPDLTIPAGRATFLCGASGAGKTTLFKLLNGVASATAGRITYLGKPIEDYDPTLLRREVLLVGQAVYLFDKTIAENFAEFYAYRDLPAPDDATMRTYLDIAAAPFPLESVCATLSGGERQRVFLAICISLHPKVLLLDEPTSALDDNTAGVLMARVKAHCADHGITLLVVSHDKAIAERFADEIIHLEGGAAEWTV